MNLVADGIGEHMRVLIMHSIQLRLFLSGAKRRVYLMYEYKSKMPFYHLYLKGHKPFFLVVDFKISL